MVFEFDPRDLEDTPAQSTFRAHANYLRAFAMVTSGAVVMDIEATLTRTAQAVDAAVPRASPRAVDEQVLRGCLSRAWGTELLLATGRRVAAEDEQLRLINSWGVVQAYYAAYSATQALLVSEGKPRPTTHPATQRSAIDLWVTRTFKVAPWSFAMGPPGSPPAGPDGSINGPGRRIEEAHPWSACTPERCWDIAALALRSTREDAVENALRAERREKLARRRKLWKEQESARLAQGQKPRKEPRWPKQASLNASETQRVRDRVRPHTLLDYLYRLRIKANYEDATVFIEGPDDERASQQVARDLELLIAATLLAHEIRIGRVIGAARVKRLADEWLRTSGVVGSDIALAGRRRLLETYL